MRAKNASETRSFDSGRSRVKQRRENTRHVQTGASVNKYQFTSIATLGAKDRERSLVDIATSTRHRSCSNFAHRRRPCDAASSRLNRLPPSKEWRIMGEGVCQRSDQAHSDCLQRKSFVYLRKPVDIPWDPWGGTNYNISNTLSTGPTRHNHKGELRVRVDLTWCQ